MRLSAGIRKSEIEAELGICRRDLKKLEEGGDMRLSYYVRLLRYYADE